jgi:hypothetical protein
MSASWVERPRTDGGASVQIKWGDVDHHRAWQSETFTDRSLAAQFQSAVTAAGDRWPPGWIRGAGWAWQSPTVTTLDEVYQSWSQRQSRRVVGGHLTAYTLQRYHADYRRHIRDAFGNQDFTSITLEDIEDWLADRLDDGLSAKTGESRGVVGFEGLRRGGGAA